MQSILAIAITGTPSGSLSVHWIAILVYSNSGESQLDCRLQVAPNETPAGGIEKVRAHFCNNKLAAVEPPQVVLYEELEGAIG
jgi:hypothetical protein